jgi:acetyltransferase-like isoleucine patch superfamily enzyme
MKNLFLYLRYDWPVHFILLLTNWLPDNVIFLKLRGWLISSFVGSCKGKLLMARNVVLQNPIKIHLGESVYIGYGACFLATGEISIGDNVHIAPYCVIVSGDHMRINGSYANGEMRADPIHVMENSWLGTHVVVTAGSFIAPGSCVAAGAVVCSAFEQSSLIGGVPAKVIKIFE